MQLSAAQRTCRGGRLAEYVGDLRALGQCCRAAGRLCHLDRNLRAWGWLSDRHIEAAEEWARAEQRETHYSGSEPGAPSQPRSGSEAATSSSGSSRDPQVTPFPVYDLWPAGHHCQ